MNEVLNDTDRHTNTWRKVQAYYEARLQMLRSKNDNATMEKTQFLRGQIDEAKHILALGEEPKRIEVAPPINID